MKLLDLFAKQDRMVAITIFVAASLITSCSNSGSSDTEVTRSPVDSATSIDSEIATAAGNNNAQTVTTNADSEGSQPGVNPADTSENSQSSVSATVLDESSLDVSANEGGLDSETSEPDVVENNPIIPDPLIQNTTQVDFGITVPAYQSNSLKVGLVWGEVELSAAWVGDEFWSLSTTLPTNTEHLLTITFFDNNGDIELGDFQQMYRTGSNAAESYQVSTSQFNTDRWDADGDGTSNLSELLAGGDPLLNQSLSLEVRDSITQTDVLRGINLLEKYSAYYEESIPVERPYYEDDEVVTPHYEYLDSWGILYDRIRLTIDLDLSGNGTYLHSDKTQHDPSNHTSITQEGARTNSDDSIQWVGSYTRWSQQASCYTDNTDFTLETSRLSDGGLKQEGVLNHNGRCSSYDANFDTSYTLHGETIGDSPNCEALYGTITSESGWGIDGVSNWSTTISKSAEDTHWNVSYTNNLAELAEEYLIADPGISFHCEYADL